VTSLALLINADGIDWQNNAACTGADFDFTPDYETPAGLEAARTWCNPCPVRTECLAWAMLKRCDGYWGATNTYQRKQATRVRTRAKCFLCQGDSLVYANPHELCLACGMSWVRDVRLEPITATPLPQAAA
jgi:Transcription factor WhiB